MVGSSVLSGVGKLAGFAVNPLWGQVEYMIFYDSKIETLRHEVEILKNQEISVQQLVVEATRNAEVIKPRVTDWLKEVDELKKKAEDVLNSATNSEMRCLFLTCPNLKTRYSLGKEATEKTAEAAKLRVEVGTFQKVGETKPLVQTPYQNPDDFGAFETRISTKKEIMEAIKDKEVNIIGICGMPGVGKTSMANEIAKDVKVENLFDEVTMAVVSQDRDVTKIQDKLAEMLGLKIEEKNNEIVRAGRLRDRLGDARKSVLVILDDVWECIELADIGIPSAGDDKRLKILLTSRNRNVCTNMGAQEIFDVKVLSEEESWELFRGKAEISDDATNVIAKEVASECGGLPLALVTVGRALKKKPEYAWENALEELGNSSVKCIDEVVKSLYSSIELSYKYLESDEAKSLLKLCSLFPEDHSIPIEDLVRYEWGRKYFTDTRTLINARNKVNTIVDYLKSRYLLLSAKNEEHVKLHDVVRDVCLQIAPKDKDAYMSKHTSLEWPELDNTESYGAIGLTSTELNRLPSGLEYPNLKFLGVWCTQQSLDISKDFFVDMKILRVLDFTSMRILLPSSIQLLTNLRTLCLDHCTLKIENSTIGNLKKLEVLSFFCSALDCFPSDIAELSNLRLLDLRLKHSSMHCPCPLPSGILLKLTKLEELHMGIIQIRDDELEQAGYIIEEIRSLTCLNTFQISTNHPQFLLQILQALCIDKLKRFHIKLTEDLWNAYEHIMEYHYFSKRLDIGGITEESMLSKPAINSLMCMADHLSIETEVNNLEEDEDGNGFEYLNGNHTAGAFDRIQEIYLWGVPRMKHLWRGVIKPYGSFHNLMVLDIGYCHSIKILLSESVASSMVNLQRLTISYCDMLEEIVSTDTEQNEVTQILAFPKLQEINLYRLINFKSFRSGTNELVGEHNQLFKQVTVPNLEKLAIGRLGCFMQTLDGLRHIRSHKLRELEVKDFDYVSILFDFEITKDDAEISILSQLTSLTLRFLLNLVHITRMFPKENFIFENLTNLTVSYCDKLRDLFSPSMANSLVALKYLRVSSCGALEEIIERQEADNLNIEIEDNLNIEIVEEGMIIKIDFPKLQSLTLVDLDRFRLLSSQNYKLVFPSLSYLRIESCPVMTKFCSIQSAPILDKVRINFQQSVDVSNFMDSEGSIYKRWDDNVSSTSNINEDTGSIHIREDDNISDTSNFDKDTGFQP